MSDKPLLITNIQRMCMHDGPGIRTTVFMKGCNLHCPWCANPENICFFKENYAGDGKSGVYGKLYTSEEAYHEIVKDRKFWKYGGGVTFSGGEPLMHLSSLEPLLKRLKKDGVHISAETALFVDNSRVKAIMSYVNLFLVDMKILQPEMCKKVLGGEIAVYLDNLELLIKEEIPLILRIPCNYEYTLKEENWKLILAWCEQHPQIPVEIFGTHSLGKSKYDTLGLTYGEWARVSEEKLEELAAEIGQCGNPVAINQI